MSLSSDEARSLLKNWQLAVIEEDVLFEDPREDDIAIVVMGPTGVGKSTFINNYLGEVKAKAHRRMWSCTEFLGYYPTLLGPSSMLPGRRLVLIDTPGFNDTDTKEPETLRRIAVGLAHMRSKGMPISGVIYLNDITQRRMSGATRFNYDVFRAICGIDKPTVIMATSFWDTYQVPQAESCESEKQKAERLDREQQKALAEEREEEYRTEFWSGVIAEGAILKRVEKQDECPKRIVDLVLDLHALAEAEGRTHVKFQVELDDWNMPLEDTTPMQKMTERYNTGTREVRTDDGEWVTVESVDEEVQNGSPDLPSKANGGFIRYLGNLARN